MNPLNVYLERFAGEILLRQAVEVIHGEIPRRTIEEVFVEAPR